MGRAANGGGLGLWHRTCGGETWEDIKSKVREAVSELKDAYAAAKKELQDDEDGS